MPENQARLPFESRQEREEEPPATSLAHVGVSAVAVDAPAEDDFAFTFGIGRRGVAADPAAVRRSRIEQVEIDLSAAPGEEAACGECDPNAAARESHATSSLFPVASLGERAAAAIVDTIFLLFSYGGFLMLFGSLGGQFSFSKLNAVVYVSAFALFYVQYVALFTVFGGTTPGMMLRGLQVVSSIGADDRPSPGQLLLRSLGYVLSAGTFLLGFVWACWDEDHLTWQDRISHTYLTRAHALAQADSLGTPHDAAGAMRI